VVIFEDIIQGKLVDVVHFYLALFAHQRGLLVEDVAVVAEGLVARQGGDLLGLVVDRPDLVVLVLVDEGTHSDGDLYSFVLLHVNEYNGLYL
jgi:hypothetical protein